MRIVVATLKSWNIKNANKLIEKNPEYEIRLITDKNHLSEKILEAFDPEYVFFPHWSWIISSAIYKKYHCIVFHMTDLPFGRGGSPLQNLLARGIYSTKISAIRVVESLDAGDIYCKIPLDISEGNTTEIFTKVSDIIFSQMIPYIIENKPTPKTQEGKVVEFKRRKPKDSDISDLSDLDKIYDFIRMLDGEGYPPAYIETETLRMEFREARRDEKMVHATCRIRLKGKKDEQRTHSSGSS